MKERRAMSHDSDLCYHIYTIYRYRYISHLYAEAVFLC